MCAAGVQGKASEDKPMLKHVAFSTWDEVLDEIRRDRPTVLQIGSVCEKHAGMQLIRPRVQPEGILPAFKAWSVHAGWIVKTA